jgi:hypothetical protein
MEPLDTDVISKRRKAKSGRIDRHLRVWAKKVHASALASHPVRIHAMGCH